MTAFADLTSDTARMVKLREHLAHPLGGPVPAPWVEWLLSRLNAADPSLERVYQIAEDLVAIEATGPTAQHARRAGRRICNIIDQVDEALGLDGDAE